MNPIFTYNHADEFEQLYISLREKEGRIYKDAEVARLPEIDSAHIYHEEWDIRKRSLKRLVAAVKQRGNDSDILEVGCGNGWLAAQLAAVTNGNVVGIDLNSVELDQAKRVFHDITNLEFINCTLQDEQLQEQNFDIIVFAASIQYFSSLKKIISVASEYLTLQGEIHIIDSHFYKQSEIAAAKERTDAYFSTVGFEDMEAFYFHHPVNDLEKLNANILFNPRSLLNRFSKQKNPFYHVVIKNPYQ